MAQCISGHSSGLLKAIMDAGIVPDNCRRVIIDIEFDAIVKVYYECFGDTRLNDVGFAEQLDAMIKEIEAQKHLDENLEEAQELENKA